MRVTDDDDDARARGGGDRGRGYGGAKSRRARAARASREPRANRGALPLKTPVVASEDTNRRLFDDASPSDARDLSAWFAFADDAIADDRDRRRVLARRGDAARRDGGVGAGERARLVRDDRGGASARIRRRPGSIVHARRGARESRRRDVREKEKDSMRGVRRADVARGGERGEAHVGVGARDGAERATATGARDGRD